MVKYFSFYRDEGYCQLCGGPSVLAWCGACHADMLYSDPVCVRCARPLPQTGLCGVCQNTPPFYSRCKALYRYTFPCKELIFKYKYQSCSELAHSFSGYFYNKFENKIKGLHGIVLPVPLHWKRQYRRGFNQSSFFARRLATQLNLPFSPNMICRVRETRSQTLLSAGLRRKNVKDAFRIRDDFDYKTVVLVDDVVTTGTTANEISRLLKKHGAENIELWVIARANYPQSQNSSKHPGFPLLAR